MIAKRIFFQRWGYFLLLFAFIFDVASIVFVSIKIQQYTSSIIDLYHLIITISCALFIRIFSLFFIKRMAYRKFYNNKVLFNKNLLNKFLKSYQNNTKPNIDKVREQITFSSDLAVVNFDVPLSLIIGEFIVIVVSLTYIFYKIEINFLFLPAAILGIFILIFYIFSVKLISIFGKQIIFTQDRKMAWLSNILNSGLNLSINNSYDTCINIHATNENDYNKNVIYLSIVNQFVALLFEITLVMAGVIVLMGTDRIETILSLTPFVARVAPSLTRIATNFAQMSYGYQAVKKLG